MSSVIISGDTSGAITLSAPAVAGTTTLTLPATTGTVLADTTVGVCRAWVNFNGTSTVAIRASFNVTSITDNGTGDYTVNFTSALVDANYAVEATGNTNVTTGGGNFFNAPAYQAPSTSAVRVATFNQGGSNTDMQYVNVAVFR